MRKDGGRVAEAVRMHRARDSSGSTREDVRRNSNQDPSGRCLSRSLFRHRTGIQRGPVSSLEDSLDDSNEYWRFDMDESEEVHLLIHITINIVNYPPILDITASEMQLFCIH
jgi:hypothetical protein